MVDAAKEKIRSRGFRWLIYCAAFAVFASAGGWALRSWVLSSTAGASVRTARAIAEALPRPRHPEAPLREDLLFPLWPLDRLPDVGAGKSRSPPAPAGVEEDVSRPTAVPRPKKKRPTLGPPPKNVRASVERVLRWANEQIVPRGRTRPAVGDLPAGIDLYDVGALGIGLRDGDRLLAVDGVSVLERSQVIAAVLGARSRRAEAMTATLARRTTDGVVRFTVVVEQPYPEDIVDSARGAGVAP